MADLDENAAWEAGIYQIELTDPVEGGPDGINNRQAKQLANRTTYLKQLIEEGRVAPGVGVLPAATADDRKRLLVVEGGALEADRVFICIKLADDSYDWFQLV